MYSYGTSYDLLVSESLERTISVALPTWRILSFGRPFPSDALPLAAVVRTGDDLSSLGATRFKSIPIIWMSDVASLSKALACILAEQIQDAQRAAGEARLAAARLRRQNEEQARRLLMLENFIGRLGGVHFVKALDWSPTSLFVKLSGEAMQRFPLNTAALAAIDLWLPCATVEDMAATIVELLNAEGKPVARLFADLRDCRGGPWVRFAVPAPMTSPGFDVVMRVVASDPPTRQLA